MKRGEVLVMAPTQANASALCDVLAKSGIATFPCVDRRDFSVYRTSHGRRFRILPELPQ